MHEETVIQYHAEILDVMGTDADSVLVVHGGGLYGDKGKTIERWCENFRLSEPVRRRLVLENDERCFSPYDCLQISHRLNIPVVFDNHHFECYFLSHPDDRDFLGTAAQWIKPCLNTWARRGIRPKFHLSEQKLGARIGSHSDLIESIPEYNLEAKSKEAAILELYRKYPSLKC